MMDIQQQEQQARDEQQEVRERERATVFLDVFFACLFFLRFSRSHLFSLFFNSIPLPRSSSCSSNNTSSRCSCRWRRR